MSQAQGHTEQILATFLKQIDSADKMGKYVSEQWLVN